VHLGVARTFQIPRPFASMSVIDNLRISAPLWSGRPVTLNAASVTDEAMRILAQVGLAEKRDAMSGGLTQVDMRKLELARAIAAKPALLIADEAMAACRPPRSTTSSPSSSA
jgi:branched-chain amino acid transport system ATP-binding protein